MLSAVLLRVMVELCRVSPFLCVKIYKRASKIDHLVIILRSSVIYEGVPGATPLLLPLLCSGRWLFLRAPGRVLFLVVI